MCLAVEVKSGMLYYDGEPSLGRLSCKYIAIPVNLAVSLVYIHVYVSAGVWNLRARLQQGVRPRLHWLKLAI